MNRFSVVLFFSNNYAIWASNILKKKHIEHKMIPVPRYLSSDCGYCVRFNTGDTETVLSLLTGTGIEFDRIETAREE